MATVLWWSANSRDRDGENGEGGRARRGSRAGNPKGMSRFSEVRRRGTAGVTALTPPRAARAERKQGSAELRTVVSPRHHKCRRQDGEQAPRGRRPWRRSFRREERAQESRQGAQAVTMTAEGSAGEKPPLRETEGEASRAPAFERMRGVEEPPAGDLWAKVRRHAAAIRVSRSSFVDVLREPGHI